jgi:hypothetical protein
VDDAAREFVAHARETAMATAFVHDCYRAFSQLEPYLQQPWLLRTQFLVQVRPADRTAMIEQCVACARPSLSLSRDAASRADTLG